MTIIKQSIELQDEIFKSNYYVDLYGEILEQNHLTAKDIIDEKLSKDQLLMLWDNFWYSLPDVPAIRRGPFFILCDLCESERDD